MYLLLLGDVEIRDLMMPFVWPFFRLFSEGCFRSVNRVTLRSVALWSLTLTRSFCRLMAVVPELRLSVRLGGGGGSSTASGGSTCGSATGMSPSFFSPPWKWPLHTRSCCDGKPKSTTEYQIHFQPQQASVNEWMRERLKKTASREIGQRSSFSAQRNNTAELSLVSVNEDSCYESDNT